MTEEEKVAFIKSHPRMGIANISQELGISYRQVVKLIDMHNIVRYTSRAWSAEDDIFLMDNYRKISLSLLMKELDRSKSSIESRANILGIYRNSKGSNKLYDTQYDKMLNNASGVIKVAPGHIVHRMGW